MIKIELKSIKKRESGKKGRPLKDEILKIYYEIEAEIKTNDAFVLKEMEKMGLFVLASNDITLSPEDMLEYYKGQDKVEKGLRFLKDNTFSVSKVYLKKKTRIEALMMVMVLCLLIYSIAEWKLRTRLEEENETVPDQKRKPTKTPTMRWIFFLFQGITELNTQNEENICVRNVEHEGYSLEDIKSHGGKM